MMLETIARKLANLFTERQSSQSQTASRSLYTEFINPGDLCFDIGANMGNRAALFAELGARVIAVEPQRACVSALNERFSGNTDVVIVPKAVGASEAIVDLKVSSSHTISSMNDEWIDRVKGSGRFSNYTWDATERVEQTTLDNLIAQYGRPRFIKIDVEGYELEVLRGLTQPVESLSIEFTPEILSLTFDSMALLAAFCRVEWNYSLGESLKLELTEWADPVDAPSILGKYHGNNIVFGDVYIRCHHLHNRRLRSVSVA